MKKATKARERGATLAEQMAEAGAAVDAARKRAEALKERHYREVVKPKVAAMVGQCFVYMNTYGGGGRWPMYVRLVALDALPGWKAVEVQTDSHGTTSITQARVPGYDGQIGDGYAPISLARFMRAYRTTLAKLNPLAVLRTAAGGKRR